MKNKNLLFIILMFLLSVFSLKMYSQIADNPSAASVLGQTDMVSKLSGTSATALKGPNGVAVDQNTGKVFVVDRSNHRVLRYASEQALANGATAEAVFGQPDFTTATFGLAANKMNNPIGVTISYTGTMWISDFSNNRILRFDNASAKESGADADGVLGQADFTSNLSTTAQNITGGPVGIALDLQGNLWISEFNKHRVTRYDNAAAKANGANADAVFGQADFTTSASATSATGMKSPNSVYVDKQGRLWVADNGNFRVLRFDNALTKANGAAADGVLGQTDFTTAVSAVTRSGFSSLRFVAGDASGRLFVIQEASNRITIYENAASKANGADADFIWGQADYTTGTAANPPTDKSFNTPRAMWIDELNSRVWVADYNNNRVLRFNASVVVEPSLELTSPVGSEEWAQNVMHPITWTSNLVTNVKAEYSADNGQNWTDLATVAADEKKYEWATNVDLTTQALIRISDADNASRNDVSGLFSIVPKTSDITLISPNGYQKWQADANKKIMFSVLNVDKVKIEYSLNNGTDWTVIAAEHATSTGEYVWKVPSTLSKQCLIKLSDVSNANLSVQSSNSFEIIEAEVPNQDYIFFADSPTPVFYDASWGFANSPSTLEHLNSKFPVTTDFSLVGNYSLKLNWKSVTGGNWAMAVASMGWVGKDMSIKDTVYFDVFSESNVVIADMPKIYFEDLSNQKTGKISYSAFGKNIEANKWNKVKIPVQLFRDNVGTADLTRVKTIFFEQDASDNAQHTLYLDNIRAWGEKVIDGTQSNVYVVVGSSTAAGTGATVADSAWVGRFRKYVNELDAEAHVVNLAVGGFTTYDVMPSTFIQPAGRPAPKTNNNITYALSYNPKLIILNLPSNDANMGYTYEEQTANFQALSAYAAQYNVPLYVTTTQPRNFTEEAKRNSLMQVRDYITNTYGANAIDAWTTLAQTNGYIETIYDSGDGIHLNNKGHKLLYQRVIGVVPVISTDIDNSDGKTGTILHQNFPNPFNENTSFSFNLEKSAKVEIEIFDVVGNKVQIIGNDTFTEGKHQLIWNAESFSSGIYFSKMKIDGKEIGEEIKMLLIK